MKRRAMKAYSLFLLCALTWAACSCTDAEIEPVKVSRLDLLCQDFPTLSAQAQQDALTENRSELDAMFAVMGWPAPSVSELQWWAQSEVVQAFQPAVDSVYPNLNSLEHQLGYLKLKNQALHLEVPQSLRFASVTWGKPQPIVRIDSVVLIALNHYLGEDFPGYSHWEYYRRQDKTPQQLPYDLAAALVATQYPFQMDQPPTLLSWMLYEGALVEARMQLVHNAQLSLALGYKPDELQYLEDNYHQIWQDMILMKAVYSTDPDLIDRMIAPSPSSPLINHRVPGRIGRYIGYKIIKTYMQHNRSTTLYDLFQSSFYSQPQQVLIDSGF